MRICLYGAASPTIDPAYIQATEIFGRELARRGHSLVFGGGGQGLMGAAARGIHDGGGHILGIIPRFFAEDDIEATSSLCNQVIETDTMRQRKQLMEENADAFLMVPGGIGTYEEFFEILTAKQLCRHNKPIAIYNILGYYEPLNRLMEEGIRQGFIRQSVTELYTISDDPKVLLRYLESPQASPKSVKELKDG